MGYMDYCDIDACKNLWAEMDEAIGARRYCLLFIELMNSTGSGIQRSVAPPRELVRSAGLVRNSKLDEGGR